MANQTAIEWCDKTFNPWTGCTKVSPACDHCYAEGWAKRSGHVEWGPHGSRRRTSPAYWKGPEKWNAEARAKGIRYRVFCASLADVFDNHGSITSGWRGDLWHLIARTPHLDWLLLTKRPQNIGKMLPDGYGAPAWGNGWDNVWLGTTVENQTEADRRIPRLLSIPAKVHFSSCEPLLGQLDLTKIPYGNPIGNAPSFMDALSGRIWMPKGAPDWPIDPRATVGDRTYVDLCRRLRWIIAGGESGPGARPMHPDWARDLRDQCAAAGVPFLFKQWGEWTPGENAGDVISGYRANATWWDNQWLFGTTNMADPEADWHDEPDLYRVGKKRAGRLLDGVTHDAFPEVT
ncbi:protein gp37 [Defluviimonas denitrificans]|jgi:protein gp37|uniref:Protein gp37 n=1 Tax=Albidovulum denitrificans TaxID=404881 RepID=A0A2S8RWF9_9RHOB|nr:phage Gp37/Gp68 family protein [Defluviimonas denitrificans]PQV52862.1 protein gp37 [Defluviimonas denitrificans]